jgi:hypothetical protein
MPFLFMFTPIFRVRLSVLVWGSNSVDMTIPVAKKIFVDQ